MDTIKKDKICVVIPCFHNNETIRESVLSAANQKDVDVEVVIVDNGRTLDKSLVSDIDNVRIVDVVENVGPSEGRNSGVRASDGEYIAFLDADDWWKEDKLKKELAAFKTIRIKGRSPVMVFSGRGLYTHDGRDTGRVIHCDETVNYKKLLRSNQISCSSVLVKRRTILKYPMERADLHEDYICWLKMLKDDGYAFGIDEPLLCYRIRKGSKSGSKFKSMKMTYGVYKYMGVPFLGRLVYTCTYIFYGLKKYYF